MAEATTQGATCPSGPESNIHTQTQSAGAIWADSCLMTHRLSAPGDQTVWLKDSWSTAAQTSTLEVESIRGNTADLKCSPLKAVLLPASHPKASPIHQDLRDTLGSGGGGGEGGERKRFTTSGRNTVDVHTHTHTHTHTHREREGWFTSYSSSSILHRVSLKLSEYLKRWPRFEVLVPCSLSVSFSFLSVPFQTLSISFFCLLKWCFKLDLEVMELQPSLFLLPLAPHAPLPTHSPGFRSKLLVLSGSFSPPCTLYQMAYGEELCLLALNTLHWCLQESLCCLHLYHCLLPSLARAQHACTHTNMLTLALLVAKCQTAKGGVMFLHSHRGYICRTQHTYIHTNKDQI